MILLAILCLLLSPSLMAQPRPLAIKGVTVIDMTGAAPKPGHTVIITGNRITALGPDDSTSIPPNANVLNAKGKYLIPGLWDSHVHLSKAGVHSLLLFIANGVTSVRDMGGDIRPLQLWQEEMATGSRVGPRIKTAGPMLESKANVERMKREATIEPVTRTRAGIGTAAEAAAIVDSVARLGVDFLKVRTVASDTVYQAIVQAARAKGLMLTGHIAVAPATAIQAGQRSLEHSFFPPLDSLPFAQRRQLFHRMAATQIFVTPTLVCTESLLVPDQKAMAIANDRYGKTDARRRYLYGYLIADWKEQITERMQYPYDWSKTLPGLVRDLREMRAAGVPMLAGTDVGVALIYPGYSLHDELQAMVYRIGMTPMEALATATTQPAAFFHMQDSLGAIAPQQLADLLLLNDNPLEDIRNTRKIFAVIRNGKYYSRKDLQQLLKIVEAAAEKSK